MYIIQRKEPMNNGHKAYVTPDGSAKSYTASKDRAKQFEGYEEALKDCCGNEFPVAL